MAAVEETGRPPSSISSVPPARKRRRRESPDENDGIPVDGIPVDGIPVIHPALRRDGEGEQDTSGLYQTQDLLDAYGTYKAVHIPHALGGIEKQKDSFVVSDIKSLFLSLCSDDQDSWCLESGGEEQSVEPNEFLDTSSSAAVNTTPPPMRGYCSFLLQYDTAKLFATLKRLPLDAIPGTNWTCGPCLWFFFGRNEDVTGEDLSGRRDHTDSVSHDGTWHYQLSGIKRWYLRPTIELIRSLPDEHRHGMTEASTFCIECSEGDVLLVNTRLWWHRTVIPPQTKPSVSYARDFYMQKTPGDNADAAAMSNVDGLYAINDIDDGTLLFTENDMPDCELHRSSTNANCEVVELDDGTSAIVSIRNIASGEFFCIAESEEEEEARTS